MKFTETSHAHQHRITLQASPANSAHAHKGQALIPCALLLLQKRYLAVGPDAVLTSSHKDSSVNRLHPSLPTSPRRTPRGSTGPKSPRKTPAATPRSTLPPVLEHGQAAAVPTSGTSASQTSVPVPVSPKAASGDAAATPRKKHVAIAADSPEGGESTSTEGSNATGSLPALADAGNALSDRASSSGRET